ncbi:MAG: glycosyltransferase 87 family protein [Actinomycetota bacterium]|nr:glycosyltransferase 87 family protein [Actinomycetota bacterium]
MAVSAGLRILPDGARGRRRALEHVLLGALPAALTLWVGISAAAHHSVAEDFSLVYYPAAHLLLVGQSPYGAASAHVTSGSAFVYPALAAVLLAPFALLPMGLAYHLFVLICLAMVPGTLWATGVRDWRVYGAVLLWLPIVVGWQGENISVPLMYSAALTWRYRESPVVAGLVVAVACSVKPVVWPLGLWLIATRRFAAAFWSVAWGVVVNLLAWVIVGPRELVIWLRLAGADASVLWRGGYGLMAVSHHLGLGRNAGEGLLLLGTAVLAVATVWRGLDGHHDREAFGLAVGLVLIASPLVWIHYFVLLAAALAVLRPKFDAVWVVPVALWLLPPATQVRSWQVGLAWVVVTACLWIALRSPERAGWPDGCDAQNQLVARSRSLDPDARAEAAGTEC